MMNINVCILMVMAALVMGCHKTSENVRSSSAAHESSETSPSNLIEARSIAREAYAFGVPMVDTYKTMYAFSVDTTNPQYKGPFNSMLNIARVFTPQDTAFVTPNSDTPYSFAALDLRAEPIVITVPKMETNRYFVFQLMDLYTFNFSYIGSRTTGNDGGNFLIAGPEWTGKAPQGISKVIVAETALISVVGRTQLFNAADLDNVKTIQAGYKVRPLSVFLGETTPPLPNTDWIPPLAPGANASSLEFFNQLAFLLQFAQPPHTSEVELRQRFERIGIVPGKRFDTTSLSPEMIAALEAGMKDSQDEIDARRRAVAGKTDSLFGSRAFLKNDYIARATGTQIGIGANSREEAMYPVLDSDNTGQALDGSMHNYVLRFAKGQLPPVNAFWSITMYDRSKQLLVDNPIKRYLVNSSMLPSLIKDDDGGITIFIQEKSPGAKKETNWLPSPAGPFMITLRYYWPKQELLDGTWVTPVVQRTN